MEAVGHDMGSAVEQRQPPLGRHIFRHGVAGLPRALCPRDHENRTALPFCCAAHCLPVRRIVADEVAQDVFLLRHLPGHDRLPLFPVKQHHRIRHHSSLHPRDLPQERCTLGFPDGNGGESPHQPGHPLLLPAIRRLLHPQRGRIGDLRAVGKIKEVGRVQPNRRPDLIRACDDHIAGRCRRLQRRPVTAGRCGADVLLPEGVEAAVHLACRALLPDTLQHQPGRVAAQQQIAQLFLFRGRVVDMPGIKAQGKQRLLQRPGLHDRSVIVIMQKGHHADLRHAITSVSWDLR